MKSNVPVAVDLNLHEPILLKRGVSFPLACFLDAAGRDKGPSASLDGNTSTGCGGVGETKVVNGRGTG